MLCTSQRFQITRKTYNQMANKFADAFFCSSVRGAKLEGISSSRQAIQMRWKCLDDHGTSHNEWKYQEEWVWKWKKIDNNTSHANKRYTRRAFTSGTLQSISQIRNRYYRLGNIEKSCWDRFWLIVSSFTIITSIDAIFFHFSPVLPVFRLFRTKFFRICNAIQTFPFGIGVWRWFAVSIALFAVCFSVVLFFFSFFQLF